MSDMDMTGDENEHIVADILNEINNDNGAGGPPPSTSGGMMGGLPPMNESDMEHYMGEPVIESPGNLMLQRQMDINTIQNAKPQQVGTPVRQVVEVSNSGMTMTDKVLENLKMPILVLLVVYLVFNPYVQSMLSRTFPTFFGITESLLVRHGRILVLGLVCAVIYYGLSQVV
jgi:hypothetical protein